MKKLKDSISSNSLKIIELYNKVESEILDTSPDFQRKLVWKKQHKYAFINTILLNYPFPEIYIASSEMDVDSIKAKEIVVDGKQRITAIVDYIKGINDFANTNKVNPFEKLSNEEKREFLNYPVTVKDLKDLDIETIKDIFQKINSTDYSLNSNERLNAKFGDGEFAMFCKQIIDSEFNPTDNESDIVLDVKHKSFLNDFFNKNSIFSQNDKNRMFDAQFIMLITSTILEGSYFGRNGLINTYLEKYNSQFQESQEIIRNLLKSTELIEKMKLFSGSYWFNKANLFTLLIEISRADISNIDIEIFEIFLLDLEKKADIYFIGDDTGILSDEEKKYFEYSRQGSNELQARQHRGKIISELILKSLTNEDAVSQTEKQNLEILKEKKLEYSVFIPTITGLSKKIIDATHSIREFLTSSTIHDFSSQELGPDHKVLKNIFFVSEEINRKESTMSLYRTGRGDYRFWLSDLSSFSSAGHKLAIVKTDKEILVLNISKIDYSRLK